MNAAQVRAKARRAMKRREDEIEQEEIEGGEINLIPYLDIVTNLMLFLLASVSTGLILGQINTAIPDRAPPDSNAATARDPEKSPNEQSLELVVSIAKNGILLWSFTGLEGTWQEPKAAIARLADDADTGEPVYDYQALNDALYEIAQRRWAGQLRAMPTFQVLLMPDGDIPYGTLIATMDAMRCRLPLQSVHSGCILPSEEQAIRDADEPVDTFNQLYDPARAPYEPERFALFHNILFSQGLRLQ